MYGSMKPNFRHRDIISISDFSKEDILHVLQASQQMKKARFPQMLSGSILGNCFFEPSTRTRLSFEAAMHRLGGDVIGFSDVQSTSSKKGESLYDSMKMLENYADVVVIRHPLEGAAQRAAEAIEIPVINAGDGSNQHPTQTFLDLFSMQETQKRLDELHVAMVGDLKYGRTVHSLALALSLFNARLYFISPAILEMPKDICDELREKRIKFSYHRSLEEIIDKLDILYMTRIQEERFMHRLEYEETKKALILSPAHLKKAKSNFKTLHPLPRVNEIDIKVDDTPFAYYFQQANNGLYVRQALLGLILGKIE